MAKKPKKITLGDLKKLLNSLTEQELKNELFVNRDDIGVSGVVHRIRRAAADLMYDFSDDPVPLRSRSALKKEYSFDKQELAGMAVAIPKGGIYLEF